MEEIGPLPEDETDVGFEKQRNALGMKTEYRSMLPDFAREVHPKVYFDRVAPYPWCKTCDVSVAPTQIDAKVSRESDFTAGFTIGRRRIVRWSVSLRLLIPSV